MKLLLAKTIYWGGIGLLCVALLACVVFAGWGLWEMVPTEVKIIFGIIIGTGLIIAGLTKLWIWAEKYIEENK